MGASLATGVLTGIGGAIGGMKATQRTKGASDRALDRGSYESAYGQVENILMDYDELVASGRIEPGSKYYGISSGQSRLSQGLANYEQSLAAGSPAMAGYQKAIAEGLQMVDSLPSDFRRTLTEELRSSQASRGIIDSDIAGLEEAVRLAGGRESIRAARLQQAQDYFQTVTAGGLASLMPRVSDIYQGELSRSVERARGRREAAQIGAGIYGSST